VSSVALDTSVVMRLLSGIPEAQAKAALEAVISRIESGAGVFVSDLVVTEVYFALQHHYKVPKDEALDLLRAFLSEDGITCTGAAAEVLKTPRLSSAKPGFVDRLIYAEGIGVAEGFLTFESASAKLPHVTVLKA
jgi:predicted nucleic-acid-binding protein